MPHANITTDLTNPTFWGSICSFRSSQRTGKFNTIPQRFRNLIEIAVKYAFVDVSPATCAQVIELILNRARSLDDLGAILFDWHTSLGLADIVGFELSNEENMLRKANMTVAPILTQLKNSCKTPIMFVDVGTGSRSLTLKMLSLLREQQDYVSAATIDLANLGEYWSYGKPLVTADLQEYRYDGIDIARIIRKILSQQPTDTKLVISLQHAFHHWSSSKAQNAWLQQLEDACPAGTLIVFKEHMNIMDDDQLALNHLLINFRYNLIACNDDGIQYKAKCRTQARRIITRYLAGCGEFNFMSPFWLLATMNNHSFNLVERTPHNINDADKNTIYVFNKHASLKVNSQSIDEISYDCAQRKLDSTSKPKLHRSLSI